MEIKAMEFTYNPSITVVSENQFSAHINLYHGYISKINEIDSILGEKNQDFVGNSTYSKYRGLKNGETYALDGVILHELYFENIGGELTEFGASTKKIFDMCCEGFDNWKKDMINCGMSARGWCIFGFDQRSSAYRTILCDAHDHGNIVGFYPLVVLDMYEHAYFLDYVTNKKEYIENFLSNINWGIVEERIEVIEK